MSVQIQLRRGTAAEWTAANPTLAQGEAGLETDTGKIKIGHGSTAWTSLAYFGGGLADMGVFTYLDGTVAAAPGTPASGKLRLYAKTGKVLAIKDDTGAETELGAGGGTALTVEDEGTPLATAADTLDFVGDGVTASGIGTTKTITIPGAGVADILDLPTTEMDDALVLGPDGAGGVQFRAEAGGAAGPGRAYFDTLTLHPTYGDDFIGASLDGKWTLKTIVTGDLEFQCDDGSTLGIAIPAASGAIDRLIYQAAPGGDFSLILSLVDTMWNDNMMPALVIMDSAGAGVAVAAYQLKIWMGLMSAYKWSSNLANCSLANIVAFRPQGSGLPYWLKLRKVGTTYSALFSFNGRIWEPRASSGVTAPSGTWTGTVAYIGFGCPYNNAGQFGMYVDRFNVV